MKFVRRKFLTQLCGIPALLFAGTHISRKFGKPNAHLAHAAEQQNRRISIGRALRSRNQDSDYGEMDTPDGLAKQRRNRDERSLRGIASFTKGLPHNDLGEVRSKLFKKFVKILKEQNFRELDNLNIGTRPLENPQASRALCTQGVDSHLLSMPPAPSFSSAEVAAEMVELYWMALLRDTPFQDYSVDSMASLAASELTSLSDYKAQKVNNAVVPSVLFRGNTPGDLVGPFLSQFLLQDIPMGSLPIIQAQKTATPGSDYMTNYEDWLLVQNGNFRKLPPPHDSTQRYIRNGRDLAWYVWNDRVFQAYYHTASFLIDQNLVNANAFESRVDLGNPYRKRGASAGFASYGVADLFCLLSDVTRIALQAVWHQKWNVHRRLRPEVLWWKSA